MKKALFTAFILTLGALTLLGPSIHQTLTPLSIAYLQEVSAGFFVKCNSQYCTSLFIPFLAYLGNLYQNPVHYLWLLLTLSFGAISLFCCLLTYWLPPKKAIPVMAVLLVATAALGNALPLETIQVSLFVSLFLLGILALYLKQKIAIGLIALACLTNAPATILCTGLICAYWFVSYADYRHRKLTIKLVWFCAFGMALVIAYLSLIHYQLLNHTQIPWRGYANLTLIMLAGTFGLPGFAAALYLLTQKYYRQMAAAGLFGSFALLAGAYVFNANMAADLFIPILICLPVFFVIDALNNQEQS